jgi:DNA-binding helix-hairpin-helix protein with protein kinase domain
VLLLESRHRVLLIKLNPSPLCVMKCLTHIWIVTTLEYSRYPGDVGHRSPEAPIA